jgi:UDP-glucose 4-epimerase
VLITGGLGFIGSNLALKLHQLGAIVEIIDALIPEHGGNYYNISPIEKTININIFRLEDDWDDLT